MKGSKTDVLVDSKRESQRLRELIREIGLPLARLTEVTSLTPAECLKWWSEQGASLPSNYKAFGRLSEMVGIDENSLFVGTYDRDLARKRLMGNDKFLPERYQANQNSFLRTSAHIVRYVILTRGQNFADQVLYGLNVSPSIYQNLDDKINLTYFSDLLSSLERKGFSQTEMDTLASVIFLSLGETTLGRTFATSENFFEVYKTLADNFHFFDSNFEYESRFIGKKYFLKTTLPLGEHSLLSESPENVQRLLRYRHVLSAWFPYLAGMGPLFPKTKTVRKSDYIQTFYEFDLAHSFPKTKKLVAV